MSVTNRNGSKDMEEEELELKAFLQDNSLGNVLIPTFPFFDQ